MGRKHISWIRLLAGLVVGSGVLFFLVSIGDVVQLVVVGALLAYLLDPVVHRMESQGMSRTLATSVVFVLLLLALGGFLIYLFPVIAGEVHAIQAGLSVERIQALVYDVEQLLLRNMAFLGLEEIDLVDTAQQYVVDHVSDLVDYVPDVVSILGNLVVVPFIMFFLLKDGRALKKGFVNLMPNRYFELTLNVLHKMDVQLGNYLRGQVLDAIIVGVLSTVALWLLRVDYYLLIGAFSGLANLIPYVGPVVGSILAVAVSFFSGGTAADALAIVAVFAGIQAIDNAVINPLVVARNVKLHPLLILLAVIIGGQFFGVLGLLLAVPVTAVAKVILTETLENLRRYRLA